VREGELLGLVVGPEAGQLAPQVLHLQPQAVVLATQLVVTHLVPARPVFSRDRDMGVVLAEWV